MLASLVRGRLQGLPPFHFSVETLAGLAGLLPPMDALHLGRLRYFKRWLRCCPSALWTMLVQDEHADGWLALCRSSFAWFLQHYDHPLPLQPDSKVESWIQFILLDPNWTGRLRTASVACLHFRQAKAEHVLHLALFEREFTRIGAELPLQDVPSVQLPWECGLCNERFATSKGLAIHAHHKHGYKDKVRYFALGDNCQVCMQWFHSRPRLCRHLQVQRACLQRYEACFAPATEAVVEEFDECDRRLHRQLKEQGWNEFHALQACVRLPGPELPPAGSPEARYMLDQSLRRADNPLPAFTHMVGFRTASPAASHPKVWWHDSDLPSFVLQSAGGPQRGNGQLDLTGLAREYALLHLRCLVFVDFFSGYRREGDLHSILDQTELPGGATLFTISVDLCMQRKSGDLARTQADRWWKDRARSGQVCGCGGGPPCETYTAARHQEGEGPRALRDQLCPWGKHGLQPREWAQLRVGTRLMHFLTMMMLEMAHNGGCGFLEHPQWPPWLQASKVASVWGSRPMRLLRTLACVAITSFDQCVFGSEARKPTTILTVRLPSFRHKALTTGWGGRCTHAAGVHLALRGRNGRGEFRTAAHKVYPQALNCALGWAIQHFATGMAAAQSFESQLPAAFVPFLEQVFAHMDLVQPDYHGG
eukprot:Skav236462  [mRNA]  locus=scaffold1758:561243:563189:- [translate_table: standard]